MVSVYYSKSKINLIFRTKQDNTIPAGPEDNNKCEENFFSINQKQQVENVRAYFS